MFVWPDNEPIPKGKHSDVPAFVKWEFSCSTLKEKGGSVRRLQQGGRGLFIFQLARVIGNVFHRSLQSLMALLTSSEPHRHDAAVIGGCEASSQTDKSTRALSLCFHPLVFSPVDLSARGSTNVVIVHVHIHLLLWHRLNCWQAVHHSAVSQWDMQTFLCYVHKSCTVAVTPLHFRLKNFCDHASVSI